MFAMPFFNFSGDTGSQVVNPHFRYYWAAAIPLTACVLAMYGVYVRCKERKYRKEREDDLGQNQQPDAMAVRGGALQVAPDCSTSSSAPSSRFKPICRRKAGSNTGIVDPELGLAHSGPNLERGQPSNIKV